MNQKPSALRLPYFLSLAQSFLCIGLSVSVVGPTLLNLQWQTHTSTDQISYIFFARNICGILGSFLAGSVIDKYEHYGTSFLCLSVCMMSVSMGLTPVVSSLALLIFLQSFFGIAMGMTDNLAQKLLLTNCEKHHGGPYLHGLHFSFGEQIPAYRCVTILDALRGESEKGLHHLTNHIRNRKKSVRVVFFIFSF